MRPPGMLLKMLESVVNRKLAPTVPASAVTHAVIGEACGEDDNAGHECNESVKPDYCHSLAEEPALLADVAAEYRYRADTDAQSKERLPHCGRDHRPYARIFKGLERGDEIRISRPSAAFESVQE